MWERGWGMGADGFWEELEGWSRGVLVRWVYGFEKCGVWSRAHRAGDWRIWDAGVMGVEPVWEGGGFRAAQATLRESSQDDVL